MPSLRHRLKIPATFKGGSKFTLIDTSDEWGEIGSEPIVLESDEQKTKAESEDLTCFGMMYRMWNWRSIKKQKNKIKIQSQIESITSRIDVAEGDLVEIVANLLECKNKKDKNRARMLLLKKKRIEKKRDNLCASRNQLEQIIMTLEENEDQAELIRSFKGASKVLKQSVKGVSSRVEDYDDMQDDLVEAQDMMQEMHQAVSGRQNDTELEDELDELFDDDEPKIRPKKNINGKPRRDTPPNQTDTDILNSLPVPPQTGVNVSPEMEKELEAVMT